MTIGGKSVKKLVQNMMEFLITFPLARNYNLTGKKFEGLTAIMKSIQREFHEEKIEVEKCDCSAANDVKPIGLAPYF